MQKTIKGENCTLIKFDSKDERLVDLIYKLFHDKGIINFLNPDYPLNESKSVIKKWVKETAENPYAAWYIIKHKQNYIGYVCFKWRKHYTIACEMSTAILGEYRGLKLGYESSKILADYIKTLNKFKYIAAYVKKGNVRAMNNLRKFGLRINKRLLKEATLAFYNEDGTGGDYDLLAEKIK
jgi:hypothetical protein